MTGLTGGRDRERTAAPLFFDPDATYSGVGKNAQQTHSPALAIAGESCYITGNGLVYALPALRRMGALHNFHRGECAMKNNNVIEIDLVKLFRVLWRHVLVILLVAVAAGAAAFLLFRSPASDAYTARAGFLVRTNYSETVKQGTYDDAGFSVETSSLSNVNSMDTYCYVAAAPATLDAVISRAGLHCTVDALSKMIEVKQENSKASAFTVLVHSDDAEEALHIAESFARVLPDELADMADQPRIRVLDAGSVAQETFGGVSVKKVLVLAVLAAFLAACVYAVKFVADDVTGRTTVQLRDLKRFCPKLRVLGQADGDSFDDAAIQRLRTNIRLSLAQEPACRVLGVTAHSAQAEKDALAQQLAASFAQLGERVLLVDADLTSRGLTRRLNASQTAGLVDVLQGRTTCREAVQTCASGEASFRFLGAGAADAELLDDRRLLPVVRECLPDYDCILLDLGSMEASADASAIARGIDGVLLYLRQDGCTRAQLAADLSQLELAHANVLGFAMSGAEKANVPWPFACK